MFASKVLIEKNKLLCSPNRITLSWCQWLTWSLHGTNANGRRPNRSLEASPTTAHVTRLRWDFRERLFNAQLAKSTSHTRNYCLRPASGTFRWWNVPIAIVIKNIKIKLNNQIKKKCWKRDTKLNAFYENLFIVIGLPSSVINAKMKIKLVKKHPHLDGGEWRVIAWRDSWYDNLHDCLCNIHSPVHPYNTQAPSNYDWRFSSLYNHQIYYRTERLMNPLTQFCWKSVAWWWWQQRIFSHER